MGGLGAAGLDPPPLPFPQPSDAFVPKKGPGHHSPFNPCRCGRPAVGNLPLSQRQGWAVGAQWNHTSKERGVVNREHLLVLFMNIV